MSDARSPLSRTRVVRAVARKELREVVRDGRFWLVGVAVLGLLLVSLAFGFRQARAAQAERAAAQHVAEEQWRAQDDKNPHVAAHYGIYVFKRTGALSFLDSGVEPFLGVSAKLEAHKRNAFEGAGAQDGTALARFGRLSVASVLQLLVPLLVIGLGFAAWTSERERGTLRQLASLGVSVPAQLVGKALGLAGALAALVVPAASIGAVAVALLGGGDAGPGTSARLGAMALAYVVYFAAYVAVTLAVSAFARSSRVALVALLGFWVVSGLVVPRAAADATDRIAPAPTQEELGRAVRASLEAGVPGGPAREARVATITEEIMARQGFEGAETLMDTSLLEGIELQAEAAFENEVLDHHFGRFGDAIERQEQVAHWASIVSPVLAIRGLSMALAGTDYAHHRHFADAAEQHRRGLVDLLNREFTEKAGTAGWSFKAGRELWAKAPPFTYQAPGLGWVLRRQAIHVGVLLGWLVVGAVAARVAAARMRVI